MSTKTPIVIAAMNRKGGIGKTTLVRALASAIVHAGKSVLLIDTDPNRALISWQLRAQENGFGSSLMACKETLDMAALNTILDEAFTAGEADFIIIDTQGGGGVWADMQRKRVKVNAALLADISGDARDFGALKPSELVAGQIQLQWIAAMDQVIAKVESEV